MYFFVLSIIPVLDDVDVVNADVVAVVAAVDVAFRNLLHITTLLILLLRIKF